MRAHNASSHPPCRRRRHPPPSPPAHSCSPREMAKTPRPPHNAHGASEPSSIHDAAQKFPAIPPSMGHGAQLSAVARGASHPQENRLGLRAPSLPPSHGHGRRQQPPHATASMHYKRSIQIHCNVHLVCVVVCACSNTRQRCRKEGAEYVERRTKCTAETHNGNNKKEKTAQTNDCTAAQAVAIHTRFIENKKTSPFVLYKPHHTK
ncbi:hypothetical protein ECC02_009413 [Trypanosoma cruzi]|uniref:Uncharacterized protein n=1 Tax=Trypanosoma cruzi TaxID=5693 RepID=A0A7J6XTC6_TRYCR|nr:hypothetical protein ECC02_009413 [Trypanosoma cruzi]